MKKIVALILALVLCLAVAAPAFAAGTFVPSVSYKDTPAVEDAELSGEHVDDCLVISSVTDAKDKTTDIYQEARDLLQEVYEKLHSGEMKLPLEGDYVIRDLVDVSFKVSPCVENEEHDHEDELNKEHTAITVTFDLGIAKDEKIIVMSYNDGVWNNIASVTNNGDGTVTCVFEHFCPVVFCVEAGAEVDGPAQTGDAEGQEIFQWIVIMIASVISMVALTVHRRKRA